MQFWCIRTRAAREVSSGVHQGVRQAKYLSAILSSLRSRQAYAQASSHETPTCFLFEFASDDLLSETVEGCDPGLSAETDLLLQLG